MTLVSSTHVRTLLLGTALSLLVGCGHSSSDASSTDSIPKGQVWLSRDQIAAAKIRLTRAAERPLANRLVTGGKVAFDDLLVSHVFSPVTGRVAKIDANLGQRVKKGERLATIDSPDLGTAYSDLLKAKADLTAAEHDIQRQRDLFAAQAVSAAQVEQSEDGFHRAQAEMERAKLKVKLLKTSASDIVSQQYILRAPIEGEVVGRQINPGIEVQGMLSGANVATELFTIGSLDRVWMLGDIYEADLGKVKPGQHVQIATVAYPGEVFTGTIDYVANMLDPVTRVAHVRCTIENIEKKLKPEMYVTTTISLGERRGLAIPESAVLRNLGNKSVVFVKVQSSETGGLRFEVRPVELADADSGWVEVEHGLQPGDEVVSDGAILLSGQI